MNAPYRASGRRPTKPVVWSKQSILFSACNEDTRSELQAFGTLEGKHAFCVTSGGGRVLSLLLSGPAKITAVDLNPAQNALLELKMAAMRRLDHGGFLEFLGVRESRRRTAVYEGLRPFLSEPAKAFFDRHWASIENGVLYQGKLEKYLQLVANLLRLARPLGLGTLVSCETLEEQRRFLERLETPFWRFAATTVCRRSVLSRLSGDPGFFRYLPAELELHEVLYDRIHDYMRHSLVRDNPVLQLALHGRYVWEAALPPYLNASTYDPARAALQRTHIDVVTGTVHEVLSERRALGFDAFSLSDISSYMDSERHHSLFEEVLAAARPGATICSRANILHRSLGLEHARQIVRNSKLERHLARYDHSCVHEFVIGTRMR